MEDEHIYDEDYFSSFSDPLLSKKLLRFSEYPNDKTISEQMMDAEICKVIYNYEVQTVYHNGVRHQVSPKAIYYQGKRRSATELKEFRTSQQFPIFLRELEQCIAYLNRWIIEQGLTIEYSDRSALANDGLKSIPAQVEFNRFLARLKSEDFAEFDTDLFADGKKYLEKLALLVRNNRIDLTFRKNQIISLLSDEGLRRCVGGCLTILDMAVSNLENYGVYRPNRLISRFFSDILKQSAIHAPKLHDASVVSKISKIIRIDRAIGELHVFNYLLQRAKRVFNLRFLVVPEDPHISFVTGPYRADPVIREKIDSVFENDYINPVKQKLRTADFVYFISNQLREKLETFSDNPLEKLTQLKWWLSEIGEDPHFIDNDFFDDEYKFKLDFALERTVTERLFDTGWLALDMTSSSRLLNSKHFFFKRNSGQISLSSRIPYPFEALQSSYRVYYNNLELSWITIDEKKQRILDFIQHKGGFQQLKQFFQKSPQILANSLIQTTHDMSLFFQALAPEDLRFGLLWVENNLSEGFISPPDQSVVWMQKFSNDVIRYTKVLESVDLSAQKRLFIHLIERYQPLLNKLQMILNELVEIPETTKSELDKILTRRYAIFYEIMNNLLRLGIKDFSRLVFPAFHCKRCFFSLKSPIFTYIIEINFSGCKLDHAVFNTYIRNSQFNSASLVGTTFKKSIVTTSFKQTDLTTVQFLGEGFSDLRFDGAKLSTDSFLTLVKGTRTPVALFNGADLRQVDFQNRHIQHQLGNRVIIFNDALLQNTDLTGLFRKELNIVLLENANLDGANLSKCKLASIHIMYTSMRNVITDHTVLSLDQLFKLYQQGNRDFSTDFITDSDPKTSLYNSETLTGARLSLQIFLTLLNNGFTNFDQAQLDSIPSNRRRAYLKNYPTLLTSKTLKDRTQRARLERLELGQRKSQELQQIIAETLNHRQISKLHVLNQAELFHTYLFTQKNLEIQGQCVQLTAAFSEAIIRGKQAVYKTNLFVVSQWDKRLIQQKPLSTMEQTERNRFLDTLRKFEQIEDGAIRLPSWSYNKEIPIANIEALIALIDFSKKEFAWHINLIEPNKNTGHVLGVYNIQGKYAYFDSNVGYIDNISDREIFIRFLERIIKKSYFIHNDIKIYIDQYLPSLSFKQNPIKTDLDIALYSVLLTERQRLSLQDNALCYLVINGQLIERTQLYDIGFSYHEDGNLDLPGQLIDAKMKLEQNFLDEGLLNNKFSINGHDFKILLLKYIQEEKKSIANKSNGKRKLNFDLKMMRSLASLPNYQVLKSPISTESLIPFFEINDSSLQRRTHLRSIEKLLKKEVARSELFTSKLEQNQFQKGLMEGLKGIGKKVPVPKALAGLIVTKSLFDIGISLAQNNQQAALLQSLMLTYGLFAEPWVEQSIIKLPKKFANFVNQHSLTIKITDKALDAKKIVIPTRLFAGTGANVLDVLSLAQSINKFMEVEYGTKDWRDAIADMTIDSASLLTGAAVVVFQLPFGVGVGAGIILIIIKSGYDGSSLLAEYSPYNLTLTEKVQTFFRGSIGLTVSERVQYLRNRQDQIDNQAIHYWKNLRAMNERLSLPIVAYGGGLGEYVKDNQHLYREKTLEPINNKIRRINQELGAKGKIPLLTEWGGDTSPGISAVLPYDTIPNFKENLSRLTPKKPDKKNSQYLCLPAFRNESNEIQNNIKLKKTIHEVAFRCINAVVILDSTQLYNLNGTQYKKAILDMEYIYDGLIQKIPDFDNTFLIFNGTTSFFASSIFGSPTTDTFLIKTAYFCGEITLELEINSLLILEDNSDIRTHNITLANDNIMMDVIAEKFNGDIEGKFKTKNFGLVVGRQQKQDKYNCQLPVNITSLFPMLLEGLGGSLKNPDIYKDCLNVKLHASSHYQMRVNSNNYERSGWGTAAISIDTDQAGKIIITPPTEDISAHLDVQVIHFANLNLLQDSRLSYCHVKNTLVVTREFASPLYAHNLETLRIELKNYWNQEKTRSNYGLYDRNDNLIAPLLNNEIIKTFQYSSPTNIAECFYPQEFSSYRVLNITQKVLPDLTMAQNLFSLIEVEEAIEHILYDSTVIGPFELNPNLKVLNFIDVNPSGYSLTIANSGKNILNLISSENKINGFYGSKDEDHYFINLHELRGKKIIKINNYDPDASIDMLEIRTNHSFYELCIDQTIHDEVNKSFLFYVLDRHEEVEASPSAYRPVCAGEFNSSWPNVAAILLQNYSSDVYQHLEICVSIQLEGVKCFIPFLDKDALPKTIWFFKRYFRNFRNEDEFFELDPSFSDIVVEGDVTRFKAVQREQDLILIREKKDGSTGYNALSLWLPQYYSEPSRWDLFHIYNTQNATAMDSRMPDLDNDFIRQISKIAIDYILIENNLRFYVLPLRENNTTITHNQLQSNPFNRNRRDISSFLSKSEFDIGYLEISKNESFNLIDIKVEPDKYNLLFSIYMQEVATREIKLFMVTAENWDKPEYRLAGLLYRQLTILNLNQWDLEPKSILLMQLHIHEKILEHQINSVLESDLKTMVIWNKLRVFLLIPLALKQYDIQEILRFMQNTLNFEGLDEFLTYLPDGEDSQVLINDITTEIAQNETITEKIKSLLLYHVAKASFPSQENPKQSVIDSFPMVSENLTSLIFTQMRRKIFNKHLWDAQAFMKAICSSPRVAVELHEWLGTLNETSNQKADLFLRKKRQQLTMDFGFLASLDPVNEGSREKNPRLQQADNIITAEAMTSSAIRSEGWLNSLFKVFLEPFRKGVQEFLLTKHQPSFPVALECAQNFTGNRQSQVLDRCIPGVRYGDGYREGITCYTDHMQVLIFPKDSAAKLTGLEDTYSKQQFRPIEYNGRPAVYFEGDKTHVFYLPEIPENRLDQLNDQLVLLQILIHEGKKFYGWCKSLFAGKSNQSQEASIKTAITHEIKTSWRESLDNLEKQLVNIYKFAGGTVDLGWISNILEDRREEFNHLNQLSEVNIETVSAFTENLQALQAELAELTIDLNLTVIQQVEDDVRPPNNANSLCYKQDESSALIACNKGNKVILWGFFKAQSCQENIKMLGFKANNGGVNLSLNQHYGL